MTDRSYNFSTALQLANAVGEMLVEFPRGLPEGGKKRLTKLQGGYKKLSAKERQGFRERFPHLYDKWIRTTDRPKPPLDAEQPEMFDVDTLGEQEALTGHYGKLERWEDGLTRKLLAKP